MNRAELSKRAAQSRAIAEGHRRAGDLTQAAYWGGKADAFEEILKKVKK